MLTFLGGMLSAPENYKNLENYLEAAGWFTGLPGKEHLHMRPPNVRILYTIYDQSKIDEEELDMESLITDARTIILKAGKATLLNLMRLNRPGSVIDQNIDVKQVKLQLLEVANTNPDFILKSIKTAKNDINVLISKAIDYSDLKYRYS
jgi:hypothetical protein